MFAASDIADWWDEQHRQSSKALDQLVEDHPNWFAITVATLGETSMQLGAGMVDVLRLGEGAAEGGVKGFASDGLRLLQLAPAAGKLSRFVLARVLIDTGGDICTWMSATKALRQVGASAFATVDDLAKAAGLRSIAELGGAFVDELVIAMRSLGARVTNLPVLRSLADVMAAVKNKGVVLFSIEWEMAGEKVGHTLYAFRDVLGRLRLADRTGAVVSSLAELERFYPGIGQARVYGTAALVEGPRLLIIDGVGILAMEVNAQLVANPDTVAQTLEVLKRATVLTSPPVVSKGPGPPRSTLNVRGPLGALISPHGSALPGAGTRQLLGAMLPATTAEPGWDRTGSTTQARMHVVTSGDWLSKLASHYYGNLYKWPVIYAANRHVIGRDPNRILPGQRLQIPPLPHVSAARKARR